MKLSVFKEYLQEIKNPVFVLEDGEQIPNHYHLTEIGMVHKKFIDCGGVVREEDMISFQLWYSSDLEHRLTAEKTLKIIEVFEEKISSLDAEIEVEYQGKTIGKYSLSWGSGIFVLNAKATTCLAKDRCGITEEKKSCCGGGGCC